MKALEVEEGGQTPQGGGAAEKRQRKKRAKRTLSDLNRCVGRLPNGRRCEAASLRHSLYCVFHDLEMQRRRLLLRALPYEHPDEVQRLLAEVVERVKGKKLSPRTGNTLGYLATLLMQNQERVAKEKERVESAQFYAELGAVGKEAMTARWERMVEQARRQRDEEESADGEGRD